MSKTKRKLADHNPITFRVTVEELAYLEAQEAAGVGTSETLHKALETLMAIEWLVTYGKKQEVENVTN
jgi:hypothetical protein